jgi:hypothetical protein
MSTPFKSRESRGGHTMREDCKGSKAQIACVWWPAPFFFLGLLSAWLGGGPQHDRDDAMFAVG